MIPFHGKLVPHTASPASPAKRVTVRVERNGRDAIIVYDVTGDIGAIALPAPAQPARRDALWKATCFELFVRALDADGYLEWNFAPSGEWAAYAFDGYRAGMRDADVVAPVIAVEAADDRLRVTVKPALGDGPLQAGLSAVIRDVAGNTSYWALAHPPGKADFHHADCFAAELAPSPRA